MITKKLIIGIVVLLQIYTVTLWMGCRDFIANMHFSAFDSKLRIGSETANDKGYPIHIVRIFHNKLFTIIDDALNEYLGFWNIHFLSLFFTIVGFFGILCGFWYLLKNKNSKKLKWGIPLLLLLIPFIDIFNIRLPFWLQVLLLWIPYAAFSIYGIWNFLMYHLKTGLAITTGLILVSILYLFAFQQDIFGLFCYNK